VLADVPGEVGLRDADLLVEIAEARGVMVGAVLPPKVLRVDAGLDWSAAKGRVAGAGLALARPAVHPAARDTVHWDVPAGSASIAAGRRAADRAPYTAPVPSCNEFSWCVGGSGRRS